MAQNNMSIFRLGPAQNNISGNVPAGIFQADDSTAHMWYRRTFSVPSDWAGSQVVLHFGAVDWQTTVTVNGQQFPVHKGG